MPDPVTCSIFSSVLLCAIDFEVAEAVEATPKDFGYGPIIDAEESARTIESLESTGAPLTGTA